MSQKIENKTNYLISQYTHPKQEIIPPPRSNHIREKNCILCRLSPTSNNDSTLTKSRNISFKENNNCPTKKINKAKELEYLNKSLENNSLIIQKKLFFFRQEVSDALEKAQINDQKRALLSTLERMEKEYQVFYKEKKEFSQELQSLKNLTPALTSKKDEINDWYQKFDNLCEKGERLAIFWSDVRLPEK